MDLSIMVIRTWPETGTITLMLLSRNSNFILKNSFAVIQILMKWSLKYLHMPRQQCCHCMCINLRWYYARNLELYQILTCFGKLFVKRVPGHFRCVTQRTSGALMLLTSVFVSLTLSWLGCNLITDSNVLYSRCYKMFIDAMFHVRCTGFDIYWNLKW